MKPKASANPAPQLFTEVFPVRLEGIPPLHAYRVLLNDAPAPSSQERRSFGGRLAARLRALLPGLWVWAGGALLTDSPPKTAVTAEIISAIIADNPQVFALLGGIEPIPDWTPTADTLVKVVIRGLIPGLAPQIIAALAATTFPMHNARVERQYRVQGYIIDDKPVVSLLVASRVIYAPTIRDQIEKLGKATALVGLRARVNLNGAEGEIVKAVGLVREQRTRLLSAAARASARDLISTADDESWVFRLDIDGSESDFVADALQLLVGLDDMAHFDVVPAQVDRALRLKPPERARIVKAVSDVLKDAGLIANAFSTQNAPDHFHQRDRPLNLVFGGGRAKPYDPQTTAAHIKALGDYWRPPRFSSEPIRLAVINTLSETSSDFLEALARTTERDFKLKLEIVRERNMRVLTPSNLDSAIRLVQKETIDLVLILLPNEASTPDEPGIEARYAKAQAIGRGIPCLTLYESALHRPEDMPHVVIGIMARSGCAPFILEDPVTSIPDYADLVIGLQLVTRQVKEQTILTGVTRIYRSDGALVRGLAASMPSDGGISDALLTAILPASIVSGRRGVIHHDGEIPIALAQALGGWEIETGGTFCPVEIIRSDAPRLYALQSGRIETAPHGSIFRLNDREALVMTSHAPSDTAAAPLFIRTDPEFSIDDAVHSILDFTVMHAGQPIPPKLPVTIHHADHIAQGIRRGLFPSRIDSASPFWL
ncbi:MAG: hypothetical protein CUN53_04945 [Phototrophicales bacterium]|nr:MAG: hypothetical protein CUN53_04945 [Phototrophicales bacterium]